MHRIVFKATLVSAFLTLPALAPAQETDAASQAPAELTIRPAEGEEIDSYLWTKRLLVVFSDTSADPRFIKQMQLIGQRPSDLTERDVVVLTDTAPGEASDVRKELRPRGFALILIDKDGVVKLRKPSPWHTREIARSIDKTPLRRQEIRDRSTPFSQ